MAICIEDLNLKAMMKRWGRKVSDLSYYTFTTMLDYKLKRRGKRLLKIGRFQPSTQICYNCGHRQHMKLTDRTYVCPECGMTMDRDVNAARNIKSFALRDIIKNFNTDATSGINACGVEGSGCSRQTWTTKPSTMNQQNLREVQPPSISTVFSRWVVEQIPLYNKHALMYNSFWWTTRTIMIFWV